MEGPEEDDEVPEPDDEVLEDEEEEEEEEETGQADVRLCRLMSNAVFNGFESHVRNLERARERRREALAFKSAVEEGTAAADEASAKQSQDELDGLGVWREGDKYQGDVNYRTLQKLLARVDARGYERSAQQLEFHVVRDGQLKPNLTFMTLTTVSGLQAFMKAAARVIYRGDWQVQPLKHQA